jgi:hypothetical protein
MRPPAVKRLSESEYEVDWGKYLYYRDTGEWARRKHGKNEWHRERDKDIRRLLENVIAEFESRLDSEQARDTKTPSVERIAKNGLKSGKLIWHRNKDGRWFRIQSLDSKQGKPVHEKYWATLDQTLARLGGPIPSKNREKPSKQKRPQFAERNKHGGLIIHGLANSSYYTRFDIGRSKKYPKGFTVRMGRGKFFIQETMDRESLAAIEKEISWILRS